MGMKKHFPAVWCLLFAVVFSIPLWAQKSPKKIWQALRAPKNALVREAISDKIVREVSVIKNVPTPNAVQLIEEKTLDPAPQLRLPGQPEQIVASLFVNRPLKQNNQIRRALDKLWALQDIYGDHHLFPIFIRQYYVQNFGIVSPHLQWLFNKVDELQDRDLQARLLGRMLYLVRNKELLAQEVLQPGVLNKLTQKSFRLRYLSDISQITPENFDPNQLVLSIERHMDPNPRKDFPIRHVDSKSMLALPQGNYAVYNYHGPLEEISALYRFLLNGKSKRAPFTVVFDEAGKSMAIYNEDKSLWLRVSSHEYTFPKRLHVHLNALTRVDFVNAYGVEATDRVNLNLSIPLAEPKALPSKGVQQFLYEQLIVKPVEIFENDERVTLERRPIF